MGLLSKAWRSGGSATRRLLGHPATRRLLVIAAVAAVLFECAMNAFLLSGALARVISSNPDQLLVSYRLGWSLFPGYVHARDLRIRSKDGSIEFDLYIASCEFHANLVDLLGRRFHVTDVTGHGVRFLARRRMEPAEATARVVEALPPIEGLEPIPLKVAAAAPPPDDAHYKLFTVQLDRVDAASVGEIWIDTIQFVGQAHIVGGFFLRPIRWVSVGPVVATVESGSLSSAASVIAGDLTGRVETTIDGFDPRSTDGSEVLLRTKVSAKLAGYVDDLRFMNRWIDRGAGVRVRGGRGSFDVHTAIAGGVAEGDATVALDGAKVDFGARDSLAGAVRAHVEVRKGSGGKPTMDMSGSRIEVLGITATGGTEGWWANLQCSHATFTVLPTFTWNGQLELQARDTRPLASAFVASSGWPQWVVPIISSNGLRAHTALRVEPEATTVQNLVATAGPFRVQATFDARSGRCNALALIEAGPLALGVEARDGDSHVQLVDPVGWYEAQRRGPSSSVSSRRQ
jgi:hypothetical protein